MCRLNLTSTFSPERRNDPKGGSPTVEEDTARSLDMGEGFYIYPRRTSMNTREQEKTTPSKPRRFPRTAAVIHKIVGDDKKVFLSRVLFLLGPLVALFQVELLNETTRT